MTQRGFDPGDDEDDVPEWVDQVMATVAAEVRRRRKELRMSAQDLADRCEEIGHPIPRNVIANMESGRRANLPLVDVLVLAEALRTYPICLLYPVGYVNRVQRLPLQHSDPTWDAMHWFTGDSEDFGMEDDMLRNFRAHVRYRRAALAALKGEKHERWKAETAPNQAEREEAARAQADYAERALEAKYRLRSARAFIHEDGGTPPHLPPELADVDPPVGNTDEENDL
ncbi:helix-turn-helix domain-containing protein [Streptomyces sp. TRM68367]|uniref:helix-turn-helix domain-containing protein n=1 Tax=Streptomyces sp. TRM68367 TaxID=2758415 RepID=UPI00165A89FE|nr:helix-turn-helix transcriptional regulator [Streptomyces sp. TRM68367]MBC9730447.1 helix-turn-helix transcriptional regulator [Streptomyces sp. TRM68367]